MWKAPSAPRVRSAFLHPALHPPRNCWGPSCESGVGISSPLSSPSRGERESEMKHGWHMGVKRALRWESVTDQMAARCQDRAVPCQTSTHDRQVLLGSNHVLFGCWSNPALLLLSLTVATEVDPMEIWRRRRWSCHVRLELTHWLGWWEGKRAEQLQPLPSKKQTKPNNNKQKNLHNPHNTPNSKRTISSICCFTHTQINHICCLEGDVYF